MNYDKSKWGDGPWMTEPDKLHWIDEKTKLDCLIVRNSLGNLCGYVGVDIDHPLHKVRYDKIENMVNIEVHGGLTYSDLCQEEDLDGVCHIPEPGHAKDVWWIGFDCAHAGDLIPYTFKAIGSQRSESYKDIEYVKKECRYLAKQLQAYEDSFA